MSMRVYGIDHISNYFVDTNLLIDRREKSSMSNKTKRKSFLSPTLMRQSGVDVTDRLSKKQIVSSPSHR